MIDELDEKTERLVRLMAKTGLGGILLNSQHNFAWLSGGSSNGIDVSREGGVATLLVRNDGCRFILASKIEIPRMLTEVVRADQFEPVEFGWEEEKTSDCFVFERAAEVLGDKSIGTDVPIDGAKPLESLIAACRSSLTEPEIERFRELGHDAGRALRNVVDRIIPGESETEIAEKMCHELGRTGITSVVTLVAADDRIRMFRHPVPTENRWRQTLMLVTCAKRHGLIASLTRIVCVGEAPDELKNATEAAAYINARIMAATIPGQSGSALYETLADAYTKKGFAAEINLHHQGGATGYRTRDWFAHPQCTDVVVKNQAFAWNPSISGTKVEETCIVTGNGIEIITASPEFPRINTVLNQREYFSPGILVI